MAKDVDLIKERAMNRVVSHLPGVIEEVADEASGIAARAESGLRSHSGEYAGGGWNDDNASEIILEHGEVDSFVSLIDPAALSIEFGHFVVNQYGPTGEYVEGLFIIHEAAGLEY